MSPRRPPVLASLGDAGRRLADIIDQLPAAVAVCRGPDFVFVPLRGEEGAVAGVIVHAVDVTDLVRALRGAEVAERRYRVLAEANVVGVVIVDERRVLEAN